MLLDPEVKLAGKLLPESSVDDATTLETVFTSPAWLVVGSVLDSSVP